MRRWGGRVGEVGKLGGQVGEIIGGGQSVAVA